MATLGEELGVTPSYATKASWLAGVYPAEARRRIGNRALGYLCPSHLEAVAQHPERVRFELLARAAKEGLSVRQLKRQAPREEASTGVTVSGSAGDLASSARAVTAYASFDDSQLRKLLAGPNGPTIKKLAGAGRQLAARIEEHAL